MALRTKAKKSATRTNTKVSESSNNYETLLPKDRPQLVTSLTEVIENIKKFSRELASYEDGDSDRYVDYVMENMSHYRAWYAYKDEKTGTYLFAPSKYIGYQDMTANKYVETYAYMDGRKTEKILSEWFEMLDESEEDFDFLNRKLLTVFSATGKTINALFRINVLKREEDNELLEKDLVDLIYKVFLGLSDESKALIKQKISNKI
ncbi:hypothetical protein SKB0120_20770 [Moraxella osloensis]|nr:MULTISPECIES: hypothetical protein [Moraxella]MBL7668713.1 hypothetical protein [Moraxella osloensis]